MEDLTSLIKGSSPFSVEIVTLPVKLNDENKNYYSFAHFNDLTFPPVIGVQTFDKKITNFNQIKEITKNAGLINLKMQEDHLKKELNTFKEFSGVLVGGISFLDAIFLFGAPDYLLGALLANAAILGLYGICSGPSYLQCREEKKKLKKLIPAWENEVIEDDNIKINETNELTSISDGIFGSKKIEQEYFHSSLVHGGVEKLLEHLTQPQISPEIDQQCIDKYMKLVKNSQEQRIKAEINGILLGSFNIRSETKYLV